VRPLPGRHHPQSRPLHLPRRPCRCLPRRPHPCLVRPRRPRPCRLLLVCLRLCPQRRPCLLLRLPGPDDTQSKPGTNTFQDSNHEGCNHHDESPKVESETSHDALGEVWMVQQTIGRCESRSDSFECVCWVPLCAQRQRGDSHHWLGRTGVDTR